jgi:hypothetical protein
MMRRYWDANIQHPDDRGWDRYERGGFGSKFTTAVNVDLV